MKSILIIITISLISLVTFAQQPDPSVMFKDINKAGTYVNKAGMLGYTAVLFELSGTVVMLIPGLDGVTSPQATMYFGAAMVATGIVMHVISYAKFMKAGKLLENIKPSDSGIGIAIPIK